MKYLFVVGFLSLIAQVAFTQGLAEQSLPEPSPGRMYSKDIVSPAEKVCFKALDSKITNSKNDFHMDSAMTADDLADKFSIGFEGHATFDSLSFGTKNSFLNSVRDNEYQYSLNYYTAIKAQYVSEYGYGESSLNEIGQAIYDEGNNPDFRLLCGDTVIKSYDVGAIVLISLIISGTDSGKVRDLKLGFNFKTDLAGAMANFENLDDDSKQNIGITIKATQLGGEPEKLSKVISEDSVSCSIRNISACYEQAKAMSRYMRDEFPDHFDPTRKSIWSEKLVFLGKLQLGHSIERSMHLKMHDSFVTKKVLQQRDYINNLFNNVSIYYDYFKNLNSRCIAQLNGCRGDCVDVSEKFQRAIKKTRNILLEYGYECWTYPQDCLETVEEDINGTIPSIDYNAFHNIIEPAYTYNVSVNVNINEDQLHFNFDGDNGSDISDHVWDYTRGKIDASVHEKPIGSEYNVQIRYQNDDLPEGEYNQNWSDKSLDDFFDKEKFESDYANTLVREADVPAANDANQVRHVTVKFERGMCTFPSPSRLKKMKRELDASKDDEVLE